MVFWAIGTLLTNAYVVYKKVLTGEGVDPKFLLSHYDFRKDVALYWINPEKYKDLPSNVISSLASLSNSDYTIRRRSPRKKGRTISMFSPSDTVSTLTLTTPPSKKKRGHAVSNL